MTPYGDKNLGEHWPRLWIVAGWHQVITCSKVDLRILVFIPDQFHGKYSSTLAKVCIRIKYFARFFNICHEAMG